MQGTGIGAACTLLLAATCACTSRLEPDRPPGEATPRRTYGQPAAQDPPQLVKASGHLLEARRLAAVGRTADEIQELVPLVEVRDGRAAVEVALDELTPEILERLVRAGLEVESHSLRYARAYGWVELARLDQVAAIPEVATIRARPAARTRRPAPSPERSWR